MSSFPRHAHVINLTCPIAQLLALEDAPEHASVTAFASALAVAASAVLASNVQGTEQRGVAQYMPPKKRKGLDKKIQKNAVLQRAG